MGTSTTGCNFIISVDPSRNDSLRYLLDENVFLKLPINASCVLSASLLCSTIIYVYF